MKNKLWKLLLSFVIAFGLWIYVITDVSPGSEKTYYDIPVIFQNEATLQREGLMITAIEDDSVTLRLGGNRTDLNELNESNINIFANLSGILSPGTHTIGYNMSLPGHIASNAVTTLSKEPSLLVIKVENRVTKAVPVEVEYLGSVPESFIADKENAELDYTLVTVKGPESLVDKIEAARIQVDLTDRTEPVTGEFEFTLYDKDDQPVSSELITTDVGEAKDENTVNLYLNIRRYKDLDLKVTVIPGGGATQETCSVTLSQKKIRISGSEAILDSLDGLILGTVDLGKILEDTTLTMQIPLPEGVTNITGTDSVDVQIKFPELSMKTVKVKNIEAKNLPEGMEYEFLTQEMEVTLRGPIKLMKSLKDTEVKLVVDFSNAQPGNATMPATVVLGSRYAEVGAIGTYTVSVSLQQVDDTDGQS